MLHTLEFLSSFLLSSHWKTLFLIIINLDVSYSELKSGELLSENPSAKDVKRRNNAKKYIKILKEHICNTKNHPIYLVTLLFSKIYL